MSLRAVAAVVFESIQSALLSRIAHHSVARYLGDDGRCGNTRMARITPHDIFARNAKRKSVSTIYVQHHGLGFCAEGCNRIAHRLVCCCFNAERVDDRRISTTHSVSTVRGKPVECGFSLHCSELFAVVNPYATLLINPTTFGISHQTPRQQTCRRDHRPSQRASSCFVHAGNAAEGDYPEFKNEVEHLG